MKKIALLIAGGAGNRMNQNIPKQFFSINDKPVIVYTMEAFQNHPEIDVLSVVCIDGWIPILWAYAKQFNISKLQHVVLGGKNGQESIRNGVFELEKIYDASDLVLIHDSIRPMVSSEIISDCIRVAQKKGNAITAIPCAEAMLQSNDGVCSSSCFPREELKRTQTPQAFKIGDLCNLHREAQRKGITNSVASCTLMVELGHQVYFSAGSEKNVKLTTVEDLEIFKALLTTKSLDWIKKNENNI